MFVMCFQFVPDDCTEIAEVGDEVYVHYKVNASAVVYKNMLVNLCQ